MQQKPDFDFLKPSPGNTNSLKKAEKKPQQAAVFPNG
jgi:hypothetical protein